MTTEFNCDWKSIVDIDTEGYHVPMGHKDLYDLLGRSYYDQVLNDEVSRSYGNIDAGKHKSQLNQDYVNTLPQRAIYLLRINGNGYTGPHFQASLSLSFQIRLKFITPTQSAFKKCHGRAQLRAYR